MNSGFVQFTNGGETVTVNADIEIYRILRGLYEKI